MNHITADELLQIAQFLKKYGLDLTSIDVNNRIVHTIEYDGDGYFKNEYKLTEILTK